MVPHTIECKGCGGSTEWAEERGRDHHRAAELMRIENGKIVEHWDVQMGMLSTLGLVTISDPQLE